MKCRFWFETRSSMYHLETAWFIQIWREMSIWFENTNFYVSPRDYIFHPNLTWNVDLVRKHIFGRAKKFTFSPNLTWNVDFGSKTQSSMYYLKTTYFIQIWRQMSTWFENTFLVVQGYRLETSLLGQIGREMSILGRKQKVRCIT